MDALTGQVALIGQDALTCQDALIGQDVLTCQDALPCQRWWMMYR